MSDAALIRIRDFFQSLTPQSVAQINTLYTTDACFKDPFNEVRGVDAIEHIFTHLFTQVDVPRFVVRDALREGEQVFVTWDFIFRMRRFRHGEQLIRGVSHLKLAPDGKVCFHRDYWDAAEELYEKLPLLGGLMRWLKRRGSANPRPADEITGNRGRKVTTV